MADKLTVVNHLKLLALRCSEAIADVASTLNSHANSTTIHITAAERSTWNAKVSTSSATTIANNAAASALSDAKSYADTAAIDCGTF